MLREGARPEVVRANLGHANIDVTQNVLRQEQVANTVQGALSIFKYRLVRCHVSDRILLNLDVTGLQPISGRNIIYIVQGAELDIFDTDTDTLAPGVTQLDVVGQAFDVVQIDP